MDNNFGDFKSEGFGGFGNNNFGGFGSSKQKNNQITVDQLLAAAQLQGGAVAEVASELSNPRRSMLSTIGNGMKNAFTGFVDILQMPSNIVAGAMSADYTIGEALKENITPSDLFFGDVDTKDYSLLRKAGLFTARLAIDTVTDPLTYVSFGASRGILGISAVPKFFAGEKTAAKLGLKNIGDAVAISKTGESIADKMIDAYKVGDRSGFITNHGKDIEKILGATTGAEKVNANLFARELDDEISQYLTDNVLNGRLRKSDAINVLGKMVEKHPALIETIVDKGGIKFLGKSILSSQRIRGIKATIPYMSTLDKMVEPVRVRLGSLFSQNYVRSSEVAAGGGRISDEVIQIAQKSRDAIESQTGQMSVSLERVYKGLGITKEEDQFLRSAIVLGLEPADPRNSQVWATVNGIQKNGPIRQEVWEAMGIVKGENLRYQYDNLRKAGFRISNQEGYIKNVAVRTQVSNAIKKTGKTSSGATKFTKAGVLVDEAGNRYPVAFDAKPDRLGNVSGRIIEDGKEIRKSFKVVDSSREIGRINNLAKTKGKEITKQIEKLRSEISLEKTNITGKISSNVADKIEQIISDVKDITPEEKKQLSKIISDFVNNSDVNELVTNYVKNNYDKGLLKKSTVASEVDIEKVIRTAIDKNQSAEEIAQALKSKIKPLPQSAASVRGSGSKAARKAATDGVLDTERDLLKLAKNIKAQAKAGRESIIKEGLNEDAVRQLITKTVESFSDNPTGLAKAINKIIGSTKKIQDLGAEFADIAASVKIDTEEAIKNSGKFIDTVSGKALSRARATAQERDILGFKTSPSALVSSILGSQEAIKVSATREMFQEIAQKAGVAASEAPEGWRQVGITGLKYEGSDIAQLITSGKGEPIYFHPLLAKYLEDFGKTLSADDATEGVLRAYDKIQNVFKASVTAIFPAFHGRNAFSNVFLNYLDIGYHALDPKLNVEAGKMIHDDAKMQTLLSKMAKGDALAGKEYGKLMSREVFTDNTGYKWTFGELRTVMHNNVVAFNPRNLGMIDQRQLNEDVFDYANRMFDDNKVKVLFRSTNPFSTKNVFTKGGLRIGQAVEDFARSVNFMANLRATGDPLLAAERVKLALFDYQNLSQFERNVLRRLVPFYTFSRKNLELQVKTLFSKPGRIAQEVRSMQTIGDVFGGGSLTEEEKNALPDWMKNSMNTVTDREGSHITVLGSLGLPFEQPFQQMQTNQALASISPILRLPVELFSGYSAFHGKMISEVTNASAFKYAPTAIKDLIGYTEVKGKSKNGDEYTYYVSLRPRMMHLILNLPPTSRVINEIEALADTNVDTNIKAADFLFGFNPRAVDLEVEAQRRENELKQELMDVLDKSSSEIYQFNRIVLPK